MMEQKVCSAAKGKRRNPALQISFSRSVAAFPLFHHFADQLFDSDAVYWPHRTPHALRAAAALPPSFPFRHTVNSAQLWIIDKGTAVVPNGFHRCIHYFYIICFVTKMLKQNKKKKKQLLWCLRRHHAGASWAKGKIACSGGEAEEYPMKSAIDRQSCVLKSLMCCLFIKLMSSVVENPNIWLVPGLSQNRNSTSFLDINFSKVRGLISNSHL